MNRSSFIRNSLMTLAISLLPPILRGSSGELEAEEMVDVPIVFKRQHFSHQDTGNGKIYVTWEPTDATTFSLRLPKKQAEIFIEECRIKNKS